ncbi:MAG TPA: hypothetical protein VHW01_08155 [Polyangiaceae bacterium]|nr:hypothetical protein [Polyangiaceae bacterium]
MKTVDDHDDSECCNVREITDRARLSEWERRTIKLHAARLRFSNEMGAALKCLHESFLGADSEHDADFFDRGLSLGQSLEEAAKIMVHCLFSDLPGEPDEPEVEARATAITLIKHGLKFREARVWPELYSIGGELTPDIAKDASRVIEASNLVHAYSTKMTDIQIAILRDIDEFARMTAAGWEPPTREYATHLMVNWSHHQPPSGKVSEVVDPFDTRNQDQLLQLIDTWGRRGRTPAGKPGKYKLALEFLRAYGLEANSPEALEHTWQTRDRSQDPPVRRVEQLPSSEDSPALIARDDAQYFMEAVSIPQLRELQKKRLDSE